MIYFSLIIATIVYCINGVETTTLKIEKKVEFYQKGGYMIKRDKYLDLLVKNMNNGFPKVITGIRRCGKSFLLKNIFKNYLINER